MAEFIKALTTGELPTGKATAVELNGKKVAVFNVDGTFYAIDDTCTHRGGPLSEGQVDGTVVTCPWHGAEFEITNGQVLGPPAPGGVTSFEVKVEGNDVMVKV